MRRSDREITDLDEIVDVMKRCDVCRLAFADGEYPYILPLNFGMDHTDGKIVLYFHSAMEGYKTDLIKRCSKVSFEMDCNHALQYFEEKGYCTFSYESVIGSGVLSIVAESEKETALDKIMEHYHKGQKAPYSHAAIPRTLVYKLEVSRVTGKRK